MNTHRAVTVRFQSRRIWNMVLDTVFPTAQSACLLCHRPLVGRSRAGQADGNRGSLLPADVCLFCLQEGALHQLRPRIGHLVIRASGAKVIEGVGTQGHDVTVVSAAPHHGLLRNVVRQWKYDGAIGLTPWLASLVVAALHERVELGEFDEIVPVPTSADRLQKRGYDHVRLLAEAVAPNLGLPVVYELLRVKSSGSTGFTQSQTAKSAKHRMEELIGNYVLAPTSQVLSKRILLLDDIVTTGATLYTCSNALLAQGATNVTCVAIAHVE